MPITDEERRIVLDAYKRCVINTVYLEGMIENDYAVHVSHERIDRMLRMNGLVTSSRKSWIRRKVRHERESSNSLWHIDWHEVKAAGEEGSGL